MCTSWVSDSPASIADLQRFPCYRNRWTQKRAPLDPRQSSDRCSGADSCFPIVGQPGSVFAWLHNVATLLRYYVSVGNQPSTTSYASEQLSPTAACRVCLQPSVLAVDTCMVTFFNPFVPVISHFCQHIREIRLLDTHHESLQKCHTTHTRRAAPPPRTDAQLIGDQRPGNFISACATLFKHVISRQASSICKPHTEDAPSADAGNSVHAASADAWTWRRTASTIVA